MPASKPPTLPDEAEPTRAWYDRHIISAAAAMGSFLLGGVLAAILTARWVGLLGLFVTSPLLVLSGYAAIRAGKHAFGWPGVTVGPGLQSPHAPRGGSTRGGARAVGALLIAVGLAAGAVALWNGFQSVSRIH